MNILKEKNDLAPNIMQDFFQFEELLYELRSKRRTFKNQKLRTTCRL